MKDNTPYCTQISVCQNGLDYSLHISVPDLNATRVLGTQKKMQKQVNNIVEVKYLFLGEYNTSSAEPNYWLEDNRYFIFNKLDKLWFKSYSWQSKLRVQ